MACSDLHLGLAVLDSTLSERYDEQVNALSTASRIQFEVFEFDLRTRELWKHGVPIRLQDQPARILGLLLLRPGELVTRDEIRRELWPDDTFVDHEHGLHRAINKLREALCDSAADPHYIETRARSGYRFVAAVRSAVEEPDKSSETLAAGPERAGSTSLRRKPFFVRLSGSRARVLGAAAVTCAAFLALLASALRQTSLHVQVLPLVTLAGTQASPAISPDGKEIAFVYNPEGSTRFDIYLKGLSDDNFVRITNGPGFPDNPAFSPDGQRIAYSYYLERQPQRFERGVIVMSRLGGNPHLIRHVYPDGDSQVAWSPDGKSLVFADQPAGEPEGLFAVSVDGSSTRRLTSTPPGGQDRQPSVSQRSGEVVFVRDSGLHSSDLYTVDPSGGKPIRLTFLNKWTESPVWSSDAQSVIFAAELNSGLSESLYTVPRGGGDPQVMPFFGLDATHPSVTRDGRTFVFLRSEPVNISVWQLRIGSNASPTKLISSTRADESAIASPDGTRIAFVSTRDGTMALWRSDRDGSNAIRLAPLGEEGGSPSWSPDSSRIAFDNWSNGHSHIHIIGSDGGPVESLPSGSFNDTVPAWLSSGTSLLFTSNRSGTFEIWTSDLSGMNATQLTHSGAVWPCLSPDRSYVYFNKPRDKTVGVPSPGVWRIPVSGGKEQLVAKLPEWDWRVSDNGVYFVNNGTSMLEYEEFFTGNTKVLQSLNNPPLGRNLSISPDGFLFYPQRAPDRAEILIAQGGKW